MQRSMQGLGGPQRRPRHPGACAWTPLKEGIQVPQPEGKTFDQIREANLRAIGWLPRPEWAPYAGKEFRPKPEPRPETPAKETVVFES